MISSRAAARRRIGPRWRTPSCRDHRPTLDNAQSVISRLEEDDGAHNRLGTLARAANTLDQHLIVSVPTDVPNHLHDAIQAA